MAGDDWMDAYIADALEVTGTRKAPTPQPKPPAPKKLTTARPSSTGAQPHTVVPRTPPPASTAPSVGRTPFIARIPTNVPIDDAPITSIDRARPPRPTTSPPPVVARAKTSPPSPLVRARTRDLGLDPFDEDTVPDTGSHSALTDQDERGVRRR